MGGVFLLAAAALAVPLPALGDPPPKPLPLLAAPSPATTEPLTDDQQKAQQHFQRAKDLYQQGAYREAIGELELARSLDPHAKDLVFNLGIVHEKLGKFDEAITFFRQYIEMEGVTPQEKAKAESILKRIEGAKKEVPTASPPAATPQAAPKPAEGPEPSPPHGRVDGWTIGAASLAVVGLGVGAGFGIRALTSRPTNFVTGRDGTYDDLKTKQESAHTSAIIADVGLGVGVAAAVAAAFLFFARTKDPARGPSRGGNLTPSAALLPGGGALTAAVSLP